MDGIARDWHQHLTNMIEISQSKQQVEQLCILEQSSVTDFGITKLSFDNTERMFYLLDDNYLDRLRESTSMSSYLFNRSKNLPGNHITQQQKSTYMKNRQRGFSQEISSAKADISVRSGRRIEKHQRGRKKQRHWRTRQDPFEAVWESEIPPLLVREFELTGTAFWEYLDDHYPGQYSEKLMTTLQRRVIPIIARNSNNIGFTFGRGHHGTEGKWDGAT